MTPLCDAQFAGEVITTPESEKVAAIRNRGKHRAWQNPEDDSGYDEPI